MVEQAEIQAREVGKKIKKPLRERRGIKSNELADRSGLTAQTISRIEKKGHTDVSFGTLKKMLAAMGLSLKDLAELQLDSETEQDKTFSNLLKKIIKSGN